MIPIYDKKRRMLESAFLKQLFEADLIVVIRGTDLEARRDTVKVLSTTPQMISESSKQRMLSLMLTWSLESMPVPQGRAGCDDDGAGISVHEDRCLSRCRLCRSVESRRSPRSHLCEVRC